MARVSPLKGMPLALLHVGGTQVTDLSPFADCQELKEVTLPPNAKDIEFFLTFPKPERISFTEDEATKARRPDMTAAEFWQEYDAGKK